MSIRFLFLSLTLLALSLSLTTQPAQSQSVLDTNGNPLKRGNEYYIKPAITDNGGRFTLINRNGSCPLNVGLENTDLPEGLPVTFTPFADNDNVIEVNRDFKVSFNASTICVQSTEWLVGQNDTQSGRRLIITGKGEGRGFGNYFRIVEGQIAGVYNIQWCPTEVCPTCRFICGTASGLREGGGQKDPNSKILLALDGPGVLPVQFYKKSDVIYTSGFDI